MIKKNKDLFKKSWQYYISRNVSVWHNELTLYSTVKDYKRYRLPIFLQFRLHHGVHSDFYVLEKGKFGRANFTEELMNNLSNPKYVGFLKNIYKKNGKKLTSLAKLSKVDYKSLKKFFKFYQYCICMLEITAMASKLVTDKVLELLKGYENKEEIIAYYSKSKGLAPIQKLEKDLDKLYGKKINVLKEAKKLHKKYCWIPINFIGEPWDINYFVKIIKNHKIDKKSKLQKPKEKISDEYYLNLLSEITYLNEYRKSFFTQANYLVRPVFEKIANKNKLKNWHELSFLTSSEILDLAKGKGDGTKEVIKKRKRPFAMYNDGLKEIGFLHEDEVVFFENRFRLKVVGIKKVNGTIANKGKIVGKTKVVLETKDFKKFKQGDILVAKMTSVDFIPIMKKAAAFITDEGGLACHAAVVSREFNKPCVVGTKLATQVFKDGDRVEVDAERGIIKKL